VQGNKEVPLYRRNIFKSPFHFIFLVIFILSFSNFGYTQNDLSELVKKVLPSVVLINTFDDKTGSKGIGTGFFVGQEGLIVTNYHVVKGTEKAVVKLSTGEFLPVEEIIAEDKEADLVLLSLSAKGRTFQPLSIANPSSVKVGQPILVIGNPFGLEWTVSNGIVSAVREMPDLGKVVQITAPISMGSSGSPVVNMDGEVLGVALAYISGGQSLNFAVSGERLVKLLSQKKERADKGRVQRSASKEIKQKVAKPEGTEEQKQQGSAKQVGAEGRK
jgi:S1-C subfamily serine protease